MSINQACNPVDEDDNNDYLTISNKPFSYICLDDNLKNKIKYNLVNGIRSDYGLDLTDKDIKAEDWRVDSLMYLSKQGLDCQNKVLVEKGVIKIDDLIPFLNKGWVAMNFMGDWYWYSHKPKLIDGVWHSNYDNECLNVLAFNIEPVEDWRKSLRKVGGK